MAGHLKNAAEFIQKRTVRSKPIVSHFLLLHPRSLYPTSPSLSFSFSPAASLSLTLLLSLSPCFSLSHPASLSLTLLFFLLCYILNPITHSLYYCFPPPPSSSSLFICCLRWRTFQRLIQSMEVALQKLLRNTR